ncbi:MAG TPA: hypothetical protein DCL68_03010, partial [Gammaproteobacteria bacterium]|nr:hypothetical protein [Gammaproteobacteria bacterium]
MIYDSNVRIYKKLITLILAWIMLFPLYAVEVDELLSPSVEELYDSGKLDEPLLNMIIDHGSKDLLSKRYKVLIIPQQVITDHDPSASLSSLNQRIRSATDSVLSTVRNQNDFELRLRFRSINAIAAEVGLESLLALAADPSVRQIGLDAGGRGGLNQAIPQVNIDEVRQTYGYTGNGIEVAVLDSGIDTDHVDLQGIIASQKCLADACPYGADNAEDDNGHGTHVSGIIASQGTASPTGAASGVTIHAVKVLDSNSSFSAASIVLNGLDYVINDLPNVDIVNMSLGTNALFETDCDTQYSYTRAFSDAITTLRDRGVLSFVSSMNDASDNSIAAPACISNAIAVGAVYDTQPSSWNSSECNDINPAADTMTCFSNSSVSLDLVAPGSPITSTRRGGGTAVYSGTSMSTPLAAACAALIMEHNSAWSMDKIEEVLETSDVTVFDPVGREFPRLDCMSFSKKTQDTEAPVLTSLTVDPTSVDVSENEQTVTFTLAFTDETGILGPDTNIIIKSPGGASKYIQFPSSSSSPVTKAHTFSNDDLAGNWQIYRADLIDDYQNRKIYDRSSLDALGVPTYLGVLDGELPSTDLVLSADALDKTIVQNSSFTYPFTIKNASSETINELTLKIYTEGAAHSSLATDFSEYDCSITTENFSSRLECALASLTAGESKNSTLTLYTGTDDNGLIRLETYMDQPDSSYTDNRLDIEFSIESDDDDDDVSDGSDNCPSEANPDQIDTDGDGSGNVCDTDDDNDGINDELDAFPLDASESIDTDNDGTGNNADTDDDGDGVL